MLSLYGKRIFEDEETTVFATDQGVVDLDSNGWRGGSWTPAEARSLAAALSKAADAVDAHKVAEIARLPVGTSVLTNKDRKATVVAVSERTVKVEYTDGSVDHWRTDQLVVNENAEEAS